MTRSNIRAALNQFANSAFCLPEQKETLAQISTFIQNNPNCFDRSNTGHITSSVWIVNAEKTHALLTHHKKFDMWCQLGGHNDGDPDCKATALKEAEEESGITGFIFLLDGIFDVDIHPIPGPCAFHYDIRYLLQAPADAQYLVSDESHDLAWVPFDKLSEYTQQQSVMRMNAKYLKHN